ncbi:MAG TPA: hypothetical protein GX528_02380, partial [Firmicutes bacterium]|nr:hypothetical protein [Bacillota bacterium]
IIGEDARRLYLLKGGPGTGKSRFMKEVASALKKEVSAQELFFCSSDANSLDAVSFPKLGVALMDATAPHQRDAEWPGLRDELIYLGNFWSQAGLAARREEIIAEGLAKNRFFAGAFRYLQAARLMEENIASRSNKAENGRLGREVFELLKENRSPGKGSVRRLFASAITPAGYVSYIAELASNCENVFILTGLPGTGKSDYLQSVVRQAVFMGLEAEAYYYPLDPRKILHVLIPKLELAVLTAVPWDDLTDISGPRIDFGGGLDLKADADFQLLQNLFNCAVRSLREAQKVHLKLEQHYAANMDWAALDVYRGEVIKQILSYKKRSL